MMEDHSKANSELGLMAKQKGIAVPTNLPEANESKIYELENKNGVEFDNAYMDLMVADHEKAVAIFETQATSGKDAHLKKWAADKLPILKHHLSMARDLAAATQKLK
jgi:putative membrane protein